MSKKEMSKLFKIRLTYSIIMVAVWQIPEPFFKHLYGQITPFILSLLSMIIMFSATLQKPMREHLSIDTLVKLTIGLDYGYAIMIAYMLWLGDLALLVISEMLFMVLYVPVLRALDGKLTTYVVGKIRVVTQDKLRAKIENKKQYAAIVGMVASAAIAAVGVDTKIVIGATAALIAMTSTYYLNLLYGKR